VYNDRRDMCIYVMYFNLNTREGNHMQITSIGGINWQIGKDNPHTPITQQSKINKHYSEQLKLHGRKERNGVSRCFRHFDNDVESTSIQFIDCQYSIDLT
jgi:hypothetical protein